MRFSRLAFAAAVFSIGAITRQNGFAVATDGAETASTTPVEYTLPEGAEDYQFEAEVNRMMDIVINSLYQNKDVFLRELISNASDAIDKARFLGLTDPNILKDKTELELQIEYDEEARTLTVRDSGIGMTHDDLVQNLGTVARSGTTKFLDALKEQDKNDMGGMIGKFGVGFYSSFLVSDRVTVASKHPESDKQYIWESKNGENQFHIYADPRGNTLGRGTEIVLHLKEDCDEYIQGKRLKNLIGHYSEFITHPINLRITTTTEVEVEEEEPTEKEDETDELEVGGDDEPLDKVKPDKVKKTETVTTYDWERINSSVAIWTRDKEDISNDEYKAFWNVLSKESQTKPARWNHFVAEGSINFKSLLYLPNDVPSAYQMGRMDQLESGLKLYVRKVLISDEFDLMPKYLGFIRGVVDSDDLPLNVNRENLQETKIIRIIKKKLIRKAIDMIRTFANEPMPEDDEKEVEVDELGNVIDDEPKGPKEHPYLVWYKKFQPYMKMGAVDDNANRGKIAKLLRFKSLKSDGKWIALDDYLTDMKDYQKVIYHLAGANMEDIENSPFLERFKQKDIDVLFLTDPIDEYMFQTMSTFSGKKFASIAREDVNIGDEDADLVRRREVAYKKKFKPLTKWLAKLYGPSIFKILISKRLGTHPAIVSASEFGHTANMERIMRAQAYNPSQASEFLPRSMKVLELNPRHPLVAKLLAGSPPVKEEEGAEAFVVSKEIEDAAWLLLDVATMHGGYPLVDPEAHNIRMTNFMQAALRVDSLELDDEIDVPEQEEEPPAVDTEDFDGLNMGDFEGFDASDGESMNLD